MWRNPTFKLREITNLKNGNDACEFSNELDVSIDPAIGARNVTRGIILINEVPPTDVHSCPREQRSTPAIPIPNHTDLS
jgi:hypothetical protein